GAAARLELRLVQRPREDVLLGKRERRNDQQEGDEQRTHAAIVPHTSPGMNRPLAADVKLREVWAWSMYDFANSAYTTVVITAVFGAYFVAGVAGNAAWATFAWTAALSLSYAAILVTAPLVGACAHAHAAKKKLLLFSTAGCVLFTASLYFVAPGGVAL